MTIHGVVLRIILNSVETMVEVEEILAVFAKDKAEGLKSFISFSYQEEKEKFLDITEDRMLNESNVRDYVDEYLNREGIAIEDLKKSANKKIREKLISLLLEESNLSKRKIAVVLGLNREMVRLTDCQTNRPHDTHDTKKIKV